MYKKLLILLFAILVTIPSVASYSASVANTPSPEQLLEKFQLIPHHEMFCNDESWGGAESIKVGEKFKAYFSREFYKLFLWTECVEPEVPPHYDGLKSDFSYDIRFSFPYIGLVNRQTLKTSNFHIQLIPNQVSDIAIVGVNFNYKKAKMFTRYTLIREDGQWKIDDISPRANFVGAREASDPDGNEIAEYSFSSDSIKAEMQKNYSAAMARYNKEQAQKGIAPK